LKQADLPFCYGADAYEDDRVIAANAQVDDADGIAFASPI
jgi:NAD(P)H-dependent FMN reductase